MTRYKLTLEYDGTPFVGWQRQSEGPSVQEALEEAVFKFSGERPSVVAAGRTMSEPEYQAWARRHCVTRGARAGGGTTELKRRATADLLAFLAVHEFAPQWTNPALPAKLPQ